MVWRDKSDMCLLTNIHNPPREGNYHDEHRNIIKPAIVTDYNHHTEHVDNADRMATSYMGSHQTWKWKNKLFFHLLDLATLNIYILLSSCGGKKIANRGFQITLIRDAGTGWP
jgi:cytosine/adenosine deaminase-related metal-dependent hydrolase